MTEKIYGGPGAPRWQGYKTVDDLKIEEAKEYTKEDMIRAFVQGAIWAVYPLYDSEAAEKKARFLLERGWLGKEED